MMNLKLGAKNKKIPFIIVCWLLFGISADAGNTADVSGRWRFALDRADVGATENWFNRQLKNLIKLPGILQSQNYGDDISTETARLYTNGTGHTEREVPNLAEGADYLVMQRIGAKPLRGNSAWFGKDYSASLSDINIPVLSHETGQWVSYPDFDIIKKFTGYLRPGNYEIFRDSLASKGMAAKNKDFAVASGRYQLECYEEEIEANLRTPGMYGFQMLDLHDYLGQGTAPVGLLDAFWEEKNYVTAKEFKRFNGETVPLARMTKQVYTSDDKFSVAVEIAHFGEQPIENAVAYWEILDEKSEVVIFGEFESQTINIGKNIPLDTIKFDFNLIRLGNTKAVKVSGSTKLDFQSEKANQYKLVVGIKNTKFENDWNFWVYPSKIESKRSKEIIITHSWDEAEARLKSGGRVLYMPRKADLDWASPPLDTNPTFWNRLMNPAWGRILGFLIDKKHPLLANFPTDSFFDWQWTEIAENARAINLDRLPKNLQPIIQPIDDWNRNYKLGMIFEARVGPGKLIVSSADLENNLDERIVARQLRQSILNYMASEKFNPPTAFAAENFREILFDTRVMKKLGAKVSAAGIDAANAIDGDPNTFWIAGAPKDVSRPNQELTVAFPNRVSFSGLVFMPRQNQRDHEGDVREYQIQTSVDGTHWTDLKRGALVSTFEPQKILFARNHSAQFIKFIALSGFGADKTTAIADLAVIYTGAKLPDDLEDLEYKRVKSASTDIDESINADDKKQKSTTKKP